MSARLTKDAIDGAYLLLESLERMRERSRRSFARRKVSRRLRSLLDPAPRGASPGPASRRRRGA